MTISDRLREYAKLMEWDRKYIAHMTGIPESTVQRYLSGYTRTIPSTNLDRLSQSLGIPINYLLALGPFANWDDIRYDLAGFIRAIDDPHNILYAVFCVDPNAPKPDDIVSIIQYLDLNVSAARRTDAGWLIWYTDDRLSGDPNSLAEAGWVVTVEGKRIAAAFDSADDRTKDIVRLTLAPYIK